MQRIGPRLSRCRCAVLQLCNNPQWGWPNRRRHRPLHDGEYSPPLFSPDRPSSSTKLTAKMQVFASIISLLNDFLLAQNEPPLGFLNPWLYGHGQVGLNDITSGSNPGCNTNGFSAVVGWDPVRSARLVSSISVLTDSGLDRSQVSGPLTLSTYGKRSPGSRRYMI